METEADKPLASDDDAIVARVLELGVATEAAEPTHGFRERVVAVIALRATRIQAGVAVGVAALMTIAVAVAWLHASSQLAEIVISAYGRTEVIEP